jgi:hypothetical protein
MSEARINETLGGTRGETSGRQRSLREISAELAARGFLTERTGKPFVAAQVRNMLQS